MRSDNSGRKCLVSGCEGAPATTKTKCQHRRLNIIVVTGRSGKKVRECLDCGDLVKVKS